MRLGTAAAEGVEMMVQRGLRALRGLAGVVAALAMTGATLSAAAPPAVAAPEDITNCATALDCLYLTTMTGGSAGLPATTYDIRPVQGDFLRAGAFQIAVHSSGSQRCVASFGTGPTVFAPCMVTDRRTHWYAQPTSGAPPEGSEIVDSETWAPWQPTWGGRHTFFIVSAYPTGTSETRCLTGTAASSSTLPCANELRFRWWLPTYTTPDRAQKTPEQQAEATRTLLASAVQSLLAQCSPPPATSCSGRLTEASTGVDLSGWLTLRALRLVRRPTPVSRPVGCVGDSRNPIRNDTGALFPQRVSVTAKPTLVVSATNRLSSSAEGAIAWHIAASAGLSYATNGIGHTWTNAPEVSQSTLHDLPSQKYARGVLSVSMVRAKSEWAFGAGTFHPWIVAGVLDLDIPYASPTIAITTGPDTTLAVSDSWAPKACDALPPSTLREGQAITVANTTAPDQTAIVGDVLGAVTDTAWWDPGESTEAVTLRYQWYRQQGAEPPVALDGANGPTYRVTGADIAAPGSEAYTFLVGVTDVATENRLDSAETVSDINVATRPRRATRTTLASSGPAPILVRGQAITLTARTAADRAGVGGTVRFYSGSTLLGSRPVNAAGTAVLSGVRLPAGIARLVARFTPSDRVYVPSASTVRLQEVRHRSAVTVKAKPKVVKRGKKLTVTGRVTVIDPPAQSLLRQSVTVLVDGKVVKRATLRANGSFSTKIPASRMKRGKHRIQVSYAGSRTILVAPSLSKRIVVRRR